MYLERPSAIPGAVLWESTSDGVGRILPDGCMDLIWMRGDVQVAGPDTRAYEHHGRPGERYVGLRFAPGALPELLGVPARELTDDRVPLRDLIPERFARSLAERLGESETPDQVLEAFPRWYAQDRPDTAARSTLGSGELAGQAVSAGQPSGLVAEIARLLAAGTPVSAVAERTGLGVRRLHRLSHQRFGYGPKALASILRFQRALRLAAVEPSAAMLALRAGYADQAHLIRESHRLAGSSFGVLIRS